MPCVASLPAGWSSGGVRVRRGDAQFWLDSDLAGDAAVEVRLRPPGDCDLDGAVEVPSDELAWRRFERPERLPPGLAATRMYLSDGACVTYEFDFDGEVGASAMIALDAALGLPARGELVDAVERRSGLILCGAGAPPCREDG